jgi:hypothetical protein
MIHLLLSQSFTTLDFILEEIVRRQIQENTDTGFVFVENQNTFSLLSFLLSVTKLMIFKLKNLELYFYKNFILRTHKTMNALIVL